MCLFYVAGPHIGYFLFATFFWKNRNVYINTFVFLIPPKEW